MVHPQVGKEVPDEHVGEAVGSGEEDQGSDGDTNTEVAEENELGILALKQGAGGVEVVDTGEVAVLLSLAAALNLALVEVVAGSVGEDIHGPAEELLEDRVDQSGNWGLLGQLVELMNRTADTTSVLLAGLGDENHVALEVAGGLVVLAVGDLPGEVWHQQGRVADPAGGIVEDLGGREGLMAALVGQHPEAGSKQALEDRVEGPEDSAGRG